MNKRNKNKQENHCPDIDELIAYVWSDRGHSAMEAHLEQCGLCRELAGGIEAFKEEDPALTEAAFRRQLNEDDTCYLETLQFPKTPEQTKEKAVPGELSLFFEEKLSNILETPLDRLFSREEEGE